MSDSYPEDVIVKCILERGSDEASMIHSFRINKTGKRRPDMRSNRMKFVVRRIESLGYRW